jgi:hypothetical protein
MAIGADSTLRGIYTKTTYSSYATKVEASKAIRPSLEAIYFLDRVLFRFFKLFIARNSLTSFSSKAIKYIVV